MNLSDKIVCIENADPGYDFVLAIKLMALITALVDLTLTWVYDVMSLYSCNNRNWYKKFQQLINNDTLFLDCKKSDYSFMTIIFKIILNFKKIFIFNK